MTILLRIAVVFTLLSCAPLCAQSTINTMPQWNGTSFISSFGVTNTATYGQTITAIQPGNLLSFSFQIGNCSADVTFRGHLYAWNGTQATGPSLFDSGTQTVTSDALFHLVTFNLNVPLTPGQQYVIFASTSEDQGGAPASACRWGSLSNNTTYAGGQFVFINNGPNPGQWTSSTWATIGQDLAFTAVGTGNVFTVPVPTLSEWGMILLTGLLVCAACWRLRGKSAAEAPATT